MVDTLSNIFNLETTKTLQQENIIFGTPISQKTTPTLTRTSAEDLELAYLRDPTIFNGINKAVQTIMSAGHILKCSNTRILSKYKEFIENIGMRGNDITWDELLTQIYKHEMIYGIAWVETIYDKPTGKRIVDLDTIDPKQMDYAKTSRNKIALDSAGRPWGYVQTLPMGEFTEGRGDPIPKDSNIALKSNQIYFEPRRIARFPLFTFGDGFYPVGLIEPAINQTTWKLNAEKGLANFIYTSGFPTKIAKIGDINNPPSPQERDKVLEILKKADYSQNIVMPYFDDVHFLEASHPERMQDNLRYFTEQQVTSLGIPLPYATGAGEATNRSTLENQDRMFKLTLKDIINRTCTNIRKYIFRRIAEISEQSTIPVIQWGEIEEAGLVNKANRLNEYVKNGILTPEEVRETVIKLENLENK